MNYSHIGYELSMMRCYEQITNFLISKKDGKESVGWLVR